MTSPFLRILASFALAALPLAAGAEDVPSRPEIGAPQLAALGRNAVGTEHLVVTGADRLDPSATLTLGREARAMRRLGLRVWYPALPTPRARPVVYEAIAAGEPGHPDARFTVPGLAIAGARPAGRGFPIVLLSHGWGNNPAMLTWLGENLASKGYVVVAPEHRDPYGNALLRASGLLSRPLDIMLALGRVKAGVLGPKADPSRIALVGYSYGGYGVLTVGGARLAADSPALSAFPADVRNAFAQGGASAGELADPAVKAVVAIAPAGGAPGYPWGQSGLEGIRAPLLVLAGTADATVGYTKGPAEIFSRARMADRYLLAFSNAGHGIGTNPAPAAMRSRLWDFDWFEDPVWRKQRINAIATHFITAFLDRNLKGNEQSGAYFAVPSESSDADGWNGPDTPWDAVSKGGDNPTWLGFVRGHQRGLILRHLNSGAADRAVQ